MSEALVRVEIAAPVEKLWSLLADFGEIGWMQGVSKVEVKGSGVGMVREIYATGAAAPVVEVLESKDEAARQTREHPAAGRRLPRDVCRRRPRRRSQPPGLGVHVHAEGDRRGLRQGPGRGDVQRADQLGEGRARRLIVRPAIRWGGFRGG
ncbi:MAG: SRPBCC family protein [Deltaproteobacteria bacterium]|nr:SRPBCC family protein [Deltaproteobacteria bacterium]